MKKAIYVIGAAIAAIAASCSQIEESSKRSERLEQRVLIEKISDEVGHGMHKATVDDTIHLIIYRGVESVSVIQIK